MPVPEVAEAAIGSPQVVDGSRSGIGGQHVAAVIRFALTWHLNRVCHPWSSRASPHSNKNSSGLERMSAEGSERDPGDGRFTQPHVVQQISSLPMCWNGLFAIGLYTSITSSGHSSLPESQSTEY